MAFLKGIQPIASNFGLQVNLAQDGALKGIVKNYAMQALMSQFDDIMAMTLPSSVHGNQKAINEGKTMVIKSKAAANSYSTIFANIRRCFSDQELWYNQARVEGSGRGKTSKSIRTSKRSRWVYFKNVCFVLACEMINLYVHTWIVILRNVQKIFFSYFSPFMIIALQIAGYHLNIESKQKAGGVS